jgi:hypothetical protein
MSDWNTIKGSAFKPNEEQMALMQEWVSRYGILSGKMPAEYATPECKDLLHRMLDAGFVPTVWGWIPLEEKLDFVVRASISLYQQFLNSPEYDEFQKRYRNKGSIKDIASTSDSGIEEFTLVLEVRPFWERFLAHSKENKQ